MSILIILVVAVAVLFLGGRFYAPLIARALGERADRPTPAVTIDDGRDYVPTRTPVVFAHHYASIAGAGPIIGPILAIYYGWGPALIWILLGGVFLGAVHDYVATHVAVREGGKNLAIVARRYIGGGAFVMMLILLVALLVLVCAAFLDLSATALTSKVGVADLQLAGDQRLLRVVDDVYFTAEPGNVEGLSEGELLAHLRSQFELRGRSLAETATITALEPGVTWQIVSDTLTYRVERDAQGVSVYEQQAVIGGIASTSVIVITMFSPLLGFLYLKRKTPVWLCSLLAIGICALSIAIGLRLPLAVQPQTWKGMISVYVLFSAGLPVWLFLQSRDFINVHILYVGMVCLVAALLAAAIRGGGEITAAASAIPVSNWGPASAKLGPGWPVLFITIACGAVSGFHSLCAGGTTCKQLRTERATRHVGYYAMLLESFLAVCVVSCLIVGLSLASYRFYCYPDVGKGNAVLTFAMAVGHTAHVGLGLPVAIGALGGMLLLEGFLVTTLDTAIRLTRYMVEEAWATFFGRYDVFADVAARQRAVAEAAAEGERGAVDLVGAGGLTVERPDMQDGLRGHIVETRGLSHSILKFLRHYWVNSGIAVFLMLLLGWGNGYKVLWQIFGSSNQLLAALTLIVVTCWLVSKRRPVWYTLPPALFMLVTSVWMLVRNLVTDYVPHWADKAPLAITTVIVLVVTAGIVGSAIRRWAQGAPSATAHVGS